MSKLLIAMVIAAFGIGSVQAADVTAPAATPAPVVVKAAKAKTVKAPKAKKAKKAKRTKSVSKAPAAAATPAVTK